MTSKNDKPAPDGAKRVRCGNPGCDLCSDYFDARHVTGR